MWFAPGFYISLSLFYCTDDAKQIFRKLPVASLFVLVIPVVKFVQERDGVELLFFAFKEYANSHCLWEYGLMPFTTPKEKAWP